MKSGNGETRMGNTKTSAMIANILRKQKRNIIEQDETNIGIHEDDISRRYWMTDEKDAMELARIGMEEI